MVDDFKYIFDEIGSDVDIDEISILQRVDGELRSVGDDQSVFLDHGLPIGVSEIEIICVELYNGLLGFTEFDFQI